MNVNRRYARTLAYTSYILSDFRGDRRGRGATCKRFTKRLQRRAERQMSRDLTREQE